MRGKAQQLSLVAQRHSPPTERLRSRYRAWELANDCVRVGTKAAEGLLSALARSQPDLRHDVFRRNSVSRGIYERARGAVLRGPADVRPDMSVGVMC